jgi:hypothetical protein
VPSTRSSGSSASPPDSSREELRQQAGLTAARVVCDLVKPAFSLCREQLRLLAAESAEDLGREKAEWLRETGQPMPLGVDEIIDAAVAETRSPRSSDTVGEGTLTDVFDWQRGSHRQAVKQAELTAAAIAKTTRRRSQKGPGDVDVDAEILKCIKKMAKAEHQEKQAAAIEVLFRLGWSGMAREIKRWNGWGPNERTLRRAADEGKSTLFERYAHFLRRRRKKHGGKAGDKTSRKNELEVALTPRSRIDSATKQRGPDEHDKRSATERRRDELETQWIEGGGATRDKCSCGDPASRFRDGRPLCGDCYAEAVGHPVPLHEIQSL